MFDWLGFLLEHWVLSGLVLLVLYSTRRLSSQKLTKDDAIAFLGKPGDQAEPLMPGLLWSLRPIHGMLAESQPRQEKK